MKFKCTHQGLEHISSGKDNPLIDLIRVVEHVLIVLDVHVVPQINHQDQQVVLVVFVDKQVKNDQLLEYYAMLMGLQEAYICNGIVLKQKSFLCYQYIYLKFPTGGVAYGIPKKASTGGLDRTMIPLSGPYLVLIIFVLYFILCTVDDTIGTHTIKNTIKKL